MTDTKYNGWTNYETWNLALWLGNDEGSYSYWRERTQDAWQNAEASRSFTRREQTILDLSHELKDQIESDMPDVLTGFYADILIAAISSVDWYEIAEHMVDDEDFKDEDESCELGDVGTVGDTE